MKKNLIIHSSLAAGFLAIGIASLAVAARFWNRFKSSTELYPIFLGAMILFCVLGIIMLVFGITDHKYLKNYTTLKSNGANQKDIFIAIEKYKLKSRKQSLLLFILIPIVLFAAFGYLFFHLFKSGKINFSIIILFTLILAFLCFVIFGIIIPSIKPKSKTAIRVNGKLKSYALTNVLHSSLEEQDNLVADTYRLIITYNLDGKDYEFTSEETYSSEQLELLKTLSHIPLEIRDGIVRIDQDSLLKTEVNIFKNDAYFEKGKIAYFPSNKAEQISSNSAELIKEDLSKINKAGNYERGYNKFLIIFGSIFSIAFSSTGFLAIFFGDHPLTIVIGIMIIAFSGLIVYRSVISSILDTKNHNKTLKEGRKSTAISYELFTPPNSHKGVGRSRTSLRFKYIDDFGKERTTTETFIKVNVLYFNIYQIEKLPILIYKKYAIVDYEELLKYQEDINDTPQPHK